MKLPSTFSGLKGFRFPREVVAYAIWVYHRLALSTPMWRTFLLNAGNREQGTGSSLDQPLWPSFCHLHSQGPVNAK